MALEHTGVLQGYFALSHTLPSFRERKTMGKKDDWRQIEEWVYRALELSDADRDQMLKSLLEKNEALGKEVMALVEAHGHITSFLEPPLRFSLPKAHRETRSKESHSVKDEKKPAPDRRAEKEEMTDG